MALRGTLGDFGIADIFQLVGHQSKTGILRLKQRDVEVRISFVDGNVVFADQTSRHSSELLGNIMVRADVITEDQLEKALDAQTRTLKRLGDILVDLKFVSLETLKDFTSLQTTETIYRLFSWEAGTYEFTTQDVDWDERTQEPIRADNILMEGFRMVDEWPSVRSVIPHNDLTFSRLKPLPEASAASGGGGGGGDDEFDLDAAFGGFGADDDDKGGGDEDASVGLNERTVYELVTPGRNVSVIVDKSRLGEFDTCKALSNLVRAGYLAPDGKRTRSRILAPATGSGTTDGGLRELLVPMLTRIILYAMVALSIGVIVKLLSIDDAGMLSSNRPQVVSPGAVQHALGELQKSRVERMVERHRLRTGAYPSGLSELERAGVPAHELTFPFRARYAYRPIPADPETGRGPWFAVGLPLR
jgi:hypothetical protein